MKDHPLTVYDPDGELKRKLDIIAKVEKRNRSNLAMMFILEGIERWEKKRQGEEKEKRDV